MGQAHCYKILAPLRVLFQIFDGRLSPSLLYGSPSPWELAICRSKRVKRGLNRDSIPPPRQVKSNESQPGLCIGHLLHLEGSKTEPSLSMNYYYYSHN